MTRPGALITIVGKGNKTRSVPIGPFAWRAIERYLEVRPAAQTDAVFLREDGCTPASGNEVGKQFRRILVKLGLVTVLTANASPAERVGEDLDFQALRRTFASAFSRSGRTDDELSAMMGWSQEYAHQVRPRYTAITADDLVPGHAASSPLEAFLRAA